MTDNEMLYTLESSVLARKYGYLTKAFADAFEVTVSRPDQASAWHTYANALEEFGRWEEALEAREKALKLLIASSKSEEFNAAAQNFSLALGYSRMRLGNFEGGLPLFEIGRQGVSWDLLPGTKRWRGDPGKVIVKCEGGYGDVFLFSRWLPKVREALGNGSNILGLVVFKPLVDFWNWTNFGVDVVYGIGDPVDLSLYDYSISMMSLCAVFGIKLADIPPPFSPLIRTTQLTKTGNRVGFCWRAEENGAIRPVRSLDDDSAQLIADSLVKAGKEVYSLCPEGKDLYNHRPFNTPKGVIVRGLPDWRGTADLIASMDYVVTVDTAICHLAGLLRVPSLVVLPVNSDWKFQTRTLDQPWYGPQMKLFRNQDPKGWEAKRIAETTMEGFQIRTLPSRAI